MCECAKRNQLLSNLNQESFLNMCMLSHPKVKNIVFNFKLKTSEKWKLSRPRTTLVKDIKKPIGKNFIVLRKNEYTYIIFINKNSSNPPYVILTGVPVLNQLTLAIRTFTQAFRIKSIKISPPFVTNSTYAGRFVSCNQYEAKKREGNKPIISLCGLLRKYKKQPLNTFSDLVIQFKSPFFPGVCIKSLPNHKSGTITVFNNGNYHIVGVREEFKALLLFNKLCAIIQHTTKTFPAVPWCACDVA